MRPRHTSATVAVLRRGLVAGLATGLAATALAGCSGPEEDGGTRPSGAPSGTPSGIPSGSISSPGPVRATPVPEPPEGACYRLAYAEAVAPTSAAEPVGCGQAHTARTFAVGRLDTVVAGHLLAVDSERVRAQVAEECPDRFPGFVGGDLAARRLSVLRPVWFTPSVEESDEGASWYRCDVVALAGSEQLAPLEGPLEGVLDAPGGRERWGLCATAEPGTAGSERVPCGAEHAWRAVRVVDLGRGGYPGADVAEDRGQAPCEDAGRAAADDPLDFRWGYEWPTAEQWEAGQTYGLCWVPD